MRLLAVIALITLLIASAVVYLAEPFALRSFTYALAVSGGGCGNARARQAVMRRLDAEAVKSADPGSFVRISNDLPGRVVAAAFASSRQGDLDDHLEYGFKKLLRVLALSVLVRRDVLVDAYCAVGGSGRRQGSFQAIAGIAGVNPDDAGLRDCELEAAAQLFVTLQGSLAGAKIVERYKMLTREFCRGE